MFLNLVSATFYFFTNDSHSKTMKNEFYFIKKVLFVLKIVNFLYFPPPLFFWTWDLRPLDPETWVPQLWDSGTLRHRILTPRTPQLCPWDLGLVTLRPRILRAGSWEVNLWHSFLVSRPAPQIELTLIKMLGHLSQKHKSRVDRPKYLPKFSYIWRNTLENIQKWWESVKTKFILWKNEVSDRN